MNLNDLPAQTLPHNIEAEQSVLGALLLDNDAIDRVPDLKAEHFYDFDNARIFAEIAKQIASGKRCDPITLFEVLESSVSDCLPYLTKLQNNTPSAANISRYADIVLDRAIKRELIALGGNAQQSANSNEAAIVLVDRFAAKVEELAQKKTTKEPQKISSMLVSYMDVLEARMEGRIKPIATGFADLDKRLDGGLERGTLTTIAARPAMGKTAMALALSRNVAEWGSSLFLSMEMSADQVSDRNIAALGKIPVSWLRKPLEHDSEAWSRVTHACQRATELNMHIDDQTGLTMLEIRAKSRSVKRKNGLDLLVIDQLSFIKGAIAENKAYELGEYTRGLMALAKELDCAVVLLAQLNRECEKRPNKRPIMSDLASSGSIEQDSANVIFLYRDEVYNPDTPYKGVCEVITTKQRQGELGMVPLTYIGNQTRFEDFSGNYNPDERQETKRRGGFE